LIDNEINGQSGKMLKFFQIYDMWDNMRYSYGQLFPYMLSICQSIL